MGYRSIINGATGILVYHAEPDLPFSADHVHGISLLVPFHLSTTRS